MSTSKKHNVNFVGEIWNRIMIKFLSIIARIMPCQFLDP